MTSRQMAFVTGAWICIFSAAAAAQSADFWAAHFDDIKDANELRALHSDKTHKGKSWDRSDFVVYYRSDGKGLITRKDGPNIPRNWQVKGNDQVCYTGTALSGCRRFQRSKTDRREFRAVDTSNNLAVIFKVEDGIPKF